MVSAFPPARRRRKVELRRDRGDDRLGAVAAGHRERVGAAGDGIADDLLEILARFEFDRLDAARPRLSGEREPLGLAAARRIEDQDRMLRRRYGRQIGAPAQRR